MNTDFKAFAEDLKKIEVLTIYIDDEGQFHVENEKAGRIARVESQRNRLRLFLLEFCTRLECPEHAAEPKPAKDTKVTKRASA